MEVMVRTSLQETRGVLGDLRGGSAAPPDLGLALSRLADSIKEGSALECELRLEGDPIALSRELSTDLYRIAQEALQNALKHASAKHVQVTLSYQGDVVRLTISDDGRGFEVSRAEASAEGHFGLMGMRERAALHGTFRLVTHPERGTRIEVTALVTEKGSRHG
jgi:signal transduction histidine kinase